MPQVILYIQKNEDKIYKSDKIACYLAADSLSEERLKEAVATGKMVLTIGSTALDVCQKFGLDGVVKEIDDKKREQEESKARISTEELSKMNELLVDKTSDNTEEKDIDLAAIFSKYNA